MHLEQKWVSPLKNNEGDQLYPDPEKNGLGETVLN